MFCFSQGLVLPDPEDNLDHTSFTKEGNGFMLARFSRPLDTGDEDADVAIGGRPIHLFAPGVEVKS